MNWREVQEQRNAMPVADKIRQDRELLLADPSSVADCGKAVRCTSLEALSLYRTCLCRCRMNAADAKVDGTFRGLTESDWLEQATKYEARIAEYLN